MAYFISAMANTGSLSWQPDAWWVLVVDDSDDVREALAAILRSAGHPVRAATGPEALRWLDEAPSPPGLIILDWIMPDVGGMEILHRVRADPKTRGTSVVILTGLGARSARQAEFAALGILRIIRKPISAKELLAVVAEARRDVGSERA